MPSEREIKIVARAIADFMFGTGWREDPQYKDNLPRFGDTVEGDFEGIARAALEALERTGAR